MKLINKIKELNLLYMLKNNGTSAVNTYLKENSNIDYLTIDFWQKYLEYPFDFKNDWYNPYQIFFFRAKKHISLTSDMLIKSTYFKTMPNYLVAETLLVLLSNSKNAELQDFALYLIRRIDNKGELKRLIIYDDNIYNKEIILKIVQKALSFKDDSFMIEIYKIGNSVLRESIIDVIKNIYSINQIKEFCLKVCNKTNLIDLSALLENLVLDKNAPSTALEIVLNRDVLVSSDLKADNNIEIMKDNALLFINIFRKYDSEMTEINNLGEEILESKNPILITSWLLNINSSINKKMLSSLLTIDLSYLYILVGLKEEYLNYILDMIKEKALFQDLLLYLCENIEINNINIIDRVLDYILNLGEDLKYIITKDMALKLMSNGSYHFKELASIYEFDLDKRNIILKNLCINNRMDLMAIYEDYLLDGDVATLVPDEIIKRSTETLKLLRTETKEWINI